MPPAFNNSHRFDLLRGCQLYKRSVLNNQITHSGLLSMQILPALAIDLDALVALRIKAMQPSLEAVGRFDPERARQRFVKGFKLENTFKIIEHEQLLGFYVLSNKGDYLWIDHLYIDPLQQGSGLGTKIIERLKACALEQKLALRLGALKQSRANHFYETQGFRKIEEQAWDNIYQWSADC